MSLAAPGAASARPPVTTTGLPDTEITACACPARRSHERTMDVTTSTSRSDVRTRTSKPPAPAITSGRNTDRPPAARSPADDSSATEIAISSNHSTLTLRARPRTRAVPLTDPGQTRVRPPAREGVESRPAPAAPPPSDFAADRLFLVQAGSLKQRLDFVATHAASLCPAATMASWSQGRRSCLEAAQVTPADRGPTAATNAASVAATSSARESSMRAPSTCFAARRSSRNSRAPSPTMQA